MKPTRAFLIAALFAMIIAPAIAQDTKTDNAKVSVFYRLDFTLRELEDGKALNARNYSMVLEATDNLKNSGFTQLRVGTRMPVNLGATSAPSPVQYIDVGFNADCRMEERAGGPVLEARAELSSLADPEHASTPLLRQLKAQAIVPLTVGKPIVISSVDEPTSKRRFELQVNATKLR